MNKTNPVPRDLTGRQRVPFEDIAGYLDALAEGRGDAKDERALNGLLRSRTLRLLRQGSREEISEEAVQLSRFLESESGKALGRVRAELYGGWCAFADLLIAAGHRRDAAAVDSILRSYGGNARRLLEFLAGRGAGRETGDDTPIAVPRSEVKKHLELSESHLSHLLRDLEESDLVFRYRVPKGREVMVELGPLGQRVVNTKVFPSWVTYLVDRIADPDENRLDTDAIRRELVERGAPSEAVARELAEVLGRGGSAESPEMPAGDEDPFELPDEYRERLDRLHPRQPVELHPRQPVELFFPATA